MRVSLEVSRWERDPVVLADLAKGKMRRKIPELAQALTRVVCIPLSRADSY